MPTVVLVGTLDTKGREYAFLRDRIREHGVDVILVDAGIVGEPLVEPDVTRGGGRCGGRRRRGRARRGGRPGRSGRDDGAWCSRGREAAARRGSSWTRSERLAAPAARRSPATRCDGSPSECRS